MIFLKKLTLTMLITASGIAPAMQKEDLLPKNETIQRDDYLSNPVIIKSHDSKCTWILDEKWLNESDVLKEYLKDIKSFSSAENPSIDLASCVNPSKFTLFHPYLEWAYLIQQKQKTYDELLNHLKALSDETVYNLVTLAHYFQAQTLIDALTSTIAGRLKNPENLKKYLLEGKCNLPLVDDIKTLIAQKILSNTAKTHWLLQDLIVNDGSAKEEIKSFPPLKVIDQKFSNVDNRLFSQITFEHSGQYLIWGHYDGYISIYDIQANKILKRFNVGHTITSIVSTKSNIIITTSDDNSICLWDFSGNLLKSLTDTWAVKFIKCNKSEDSILAVRYKMLRILDIKTGKVLKALEGHESEILHACFSDDGNKIVSSDAHTMRIWDTHTGLCLKTIDKPIDSPVPQAIFNKKGTRVLSVHEYKVQLWDVATGECLQIFRLTSNGVPLIPVKIALFDASESSIITFSLNRNGGVFMRVWDVQTGECIKDVWLPCPAKNETYAKTMALSAVGDTLAVAPVNESIWIWKIRNLETERYINNNLCLEAALVLEYCYQNKNKNVQAIVQSCKLVEELPDRLQVVIKNRGSTLENRLKSSPIQHVSALAAQEQENAIVQQPSTNLLTVSALSAGVLAAAYGVYKLWRAKK